MKAADAILQNAIVTGRLPATLYKPIGMRSTLLYNGHF